MTLTMLSSLTLSPSSSPLLFAQDDDQDLDFDDGLEDFDDSQYKPPRRRWIVVILTCLLYTSPSPRDRTRSRMPSSA